MKQFLSMFNKLVCQYRKVSLHMNRREGNYISFLFFQLVVSEWGHIENKLQNEITELGNYCSHTPCTHNSMTNEIIITEKMKPGLSGVSNSTPSFLPLRANTFFLCVCAQTVRDEHLHCQLHPPISWIQASQHNHRPVWHNNQLSRGHDQIFQEAFNK